MVCCMWWSRSRESSPHTQQQIFGISTEAPPQCLTRSDNLRHLFVLLSMQGLHPKLRIPIRLLDSVGDLSSSSRSEKRSHWTHYGARNDSFLNADCRWREPAFNDALSSRQYILTKLDWFYPTNNPNLTLERQNNSSSEPLESRQATHPGFLRGRPWNPRPRCPRPGCLRHHGRSLGCQRWAQHPRSSWRSQPRLSYNSSYTSQCCFFSTSCTAYYVDHCSCSRGYNTNPYPCTLFCYLPNSPCLTHICFYWGMMNDDDDDDDNHHHCYDDHHCSCSRLA